MTRVPSEITATPEGGRALAITLARHSIHSMQGELEVLIEGRQKYAHDPMGLIAAGHVIAVEFAISAANNYWRN
jgi:Hexameric tyrosine-coordinated heme protein (HTHP)